MMVVGSHKSSNSSLAVWQYTPSDGALSKMPNKDIFEYPAMEPLAGITLVTTGEY
jgi:hypothetical protein